MTYQVFPNLRHDKLDKIGVDVWSRESNGKGMKVQKHYFLRFFHKSPNVNEEAHKWMTPIFIVVDPKSFFRIGIVCNPNVQVSDPMYQLIINGILLTVKE